MTDWTPQEPHKEGQTVKLPDGTEVTLGAAVTANDDEWFATSSDIRFRASGKIEYSDAPKDLIVEYEPPWAGLPEYRMARFTHTGPRATGSLQDVHRLLLGTIVDPDGIRWWVTTTWTTGSEGPIRYLRCDIWEIQP